ncbi:RAB6-interacting golgin [Ascaphus truei]|uniref:RAB6-interacting golgin n=1 Tax=Ascaphus truei TaxID=8439 RepID=UPI003F5A713F
MAGWAGFSEEELRRMKMQEESPHTLDRPRRQHSTGKSRQQLQREKALQFHSQRLAEQEGALSVPSEQQLSRPKVNRLPAPLAMPSSARDGQNTGDHPKTPGSDTAGTNAKPQTPDKKQDGQKKEMELKEKSHLDQLQLEQRLMEEKNKRKKALLSKAIAERSKKTHAETVKLKRIQKQLQALDDLVSTDIGILMNRIDQACVEYSQAKKRFDKAETEYIASKLDLHKKMEIKEHMTEHLCTIIQQNELRKSKKLEELMQQLDVETDEENLELEIEVEQMLQKQEAEARRQLISPQVEHHQTPSMAEENSQTTTAKEACPDNPLAQPILQLVAKSSVPENSTDQDTNTNPSGPGADPAS